MFTFRVFLLMLLAMVCEAVKKKYLSEEVSDSYMISLLLTSTLLSVVGGCCLIGTIIFIIDICIGRH